MSMHLDSVKGNAVSDDPRTFDWFVAPGAPGLELNGRKVPVWMRSAALASDGTIFAPAAIGGSETAVFLCASYDGVSIVLHRNHAFVPLDWLRREYPDMAEVADRIERGVTSNRSTRRGTNGRKQKTARIRGKGAG
jgi:hypothetical protein